MEDERLLHEWYVMKFNRTDTFTTTRSAKASVRKSENTGAIKEWLIQKYPMRLTWYKETRLYYFFPTTDSGRKSALRMLLIMQPMDIQLSWVKIVSLTNSNDCDSTIIRYAPIDTAV